MRLFCRKYGVGPPLIILHGLYGSSDNWVSIAKTLSDTFTVYLPDQRNHGQSPHSDVHDYSSMRDDIIELAEQLRLKKFFLAGHSMGGKTAISLALERPEMINGLLIADISPFKDETANQTAYNQHRTILEAIISTDLTKVSSRHDAETILMGKIASDRTRGLILKNLQRVSESEFNWKLNASALLTNLKKIMEGIDPKVASSNQITGFPVIFLKGLKSDYLNAEDYNELLKVFPAAEFIEIADAGHWIHADRPDEVVRYLKKLMIDT